MDDLASRRSRLLGSKWKFLLGGSLKVLLTGLMALLMTEVIHIRAVRQFNGVISPARSGY